eukprot:3145813-Amphidinium_carterae.1
MSELAGSLASVEGRGSSDYNEFGNMRPSMDKPSPQEKLQCQTMGQIAGLERRGSHYIRSGISTRQAIVERWNHSPKSISIDAVAYCNYGRKNTRRKKIPWTHVIPAQGTAVPKENTECTVRGGRESSKTASCVHQVDLLGVGPLLVT